MMVKPRFKPENLLPETSQQTPRQPVRVPEGTVLSLTINHTFMQVVTLISHTPLKSGNQKQWGMSLCLP